MKKSITFFVHNLYYLGGTTRAITNSANLLSKSGYDVRIISVFKGHTQPFFPLDATIQITSLIDYTGESKHRLTNIIFNRLRRFFPTIFAAKEIHPDEPGIQQFSTYVEKKVIHAIREIDTDILISTRASYNLLVAKYAPKQIELIAQEHMLFTKHAEDLQRDIQRAYHRFNRVTTLTNADAEHYKQFLPAEKVFVLPNSLPEEFEQIQIPKKENILVSAGRFEHEKGFDLLIEAIAQIKDQMNGWKVRIYGDGKDKAKLLQLITDYRLESIITLEPMTKNLLDKLLTSKIYILPSRFEGFGMVLIEAMATANAVVAFDCPVGPREIITHDENGVLVEEMNIEKLANQIAACIGDNTKIEQLAKAGLQETKKYKTQAIETLWEDLLS